MSKMEGMKLQEEQKPPLDMRQSSSLMKLEIQQIKKENEEFRKQVSQLKSKLEDAQQQLKVPTKDDLEVKKLNIKIQKLEYDKEFTEKKLLLLKEGYQDLQHQQGQVEENLILSRKKIAYTISCLNESLFKFRKSKRCKEVINACMRILVDD